VLIEYRQDGNTLGAVNFPKTSLTPSPDPDVHRVSVVHSNKHGVMREITSVLQEFNIAAISLSTKQEVGYLLADIEGEVILEAKEKLQALESTWLVRWCR